MKRLYLLRHAKSSPSMGIDADHDRPLAPRGLVSIEQLTRYLRLQGICPDVVLCSSARRTRETLDGISAGLSGEPEVAIETALYCASKQQLLDRVRDLPAYADGAMVIGHNPGLRDLALLLAGTGSNTRLGAFPPGTLIALELCDDDWSCVGDGGCFVADYVEPKGLS